MKFSELVNIDELRGFYDSYLKHLKGCEDMF